MDNIFGERYFGRKPAWHKHGTVSEVPMTAKEALGVINADYEVAKMPQTITVNTLFGSSILESEQFAIVREPTQDDPEYRIFGYCGKNFEVIQNRDMAATIDTLTGKWPVETVGSLGHGETIFMTLDAGEGEVKGEQVKQYFLVTDTQDGKHALTIAFTPVRVVCQNTLILGLQQATVNVQIQHFDTANEFATRIGLLDKMTDAMGKSMSILNKMAEFVLSDSQIEKVMKAAYPDPKTPRKVQLWNEISASGNASAMSLISDQAAKAVNEFEYIVNQSKERRDQAMVLLDKWNDEQPKLANTAWAAYNVVVENADFFRKSVKTESASELFGERAKEKIRAFNAAVDLIG